MHTPYNNRSQPDGPPYCELSDNILSSLYHKHKMDKILSSLLPYMIAFYDLADSDNLEYSHHDNESKSNKKSAAFLRLHFSYCIPSTNVNGANSNISILV